MKTIITIFKNHSAKMWITHVTNSFNCTSMTNYISNGLL